jgi:cell division protein FtsZ
MAENPYKFELPKHHKSIIKVIGVGGGGSNAVNHMFNQGIRDVEFIVCNTDHQALMASPVPNKLQIGTSLTAGLGAGANPERGRDAALESKEEIRDLLSEDTRMVFITAGMGGGTGTGAAPVIARVARELDILTVGIVTAPFSFEGIKKMQQAMIGIEELKEACDTVLVILNDQLREIYGNLSIRDAFAQADNVLTTAAKGIAEIITVPGYVNVDFEDVKTVMVNSGTAVMGSAKTEGENRARRAAEMALASPLLSDKDIHGAQKVLLSIISGEEAELQMDELTEITDYITEMTGDKAEVIFGHGIDEDLAESIRVTVIATGFEHKEELLTTRNTRRVIDLESSRTIKKPIAQMSMFDPVGRKEAQQMDEQSDEPRTEPGEVSPEEVSQEEELPRTYVFERPVTLEESKSDEDNLSDHGLAAGNEEELLEKIGEERVVEESNSMEQQELQLKINALQKQSRERIEKLRGLKTNPISDDDFKEKYAKPAYQRRNVNLSKTPHSSEQNVSRYHLNEDNQVQSKNKFLHDKPD